MQCQAHLLILKLAVQDYFQKNVSVEAQYLLLWTFVLTKFIYGSSCGD